MKPSLDRKQGNNIVLRVNRKSSLKTSDIDKLQKFQPYREISLSSEFPIYTRADY